MTDFASVLQDIPGLEHLNVSDNHLTEKSLLPLIDGIRNSQTLQHANISDNAINETTASALSSLLGIKHHCLKALVVDRADLDNDEASMLFHSLSTNDTLTSLEGTGNSSFHCTVSEIMHVHIHTSANYIQVAVVPLPVLLLLLLLLLQLAETNSGHSWEISRN
jgi:hypothetical protein